MAAAAASLLGGGGAPEVKPGKEDKDIVDLYGLIEENTLECLNQDSTHPVSHCLKQVRIAWRARPNKAAPHKLGQLPYGASLGAARGQECSVAAPSLEAAFAGRAAQRPPDGACNCAGGAG
jgi:hypothetical protein